MLNQQMSLIRKMNGFTQQQVADLLNIARATYASYETGRTRPDVSLLHSFAKIFDVTVDFILGLDDNSIYHLRDDSNAYQVNEDKSTLLSELTEEEKNLVAAYRLKSEQQKKAILKQAMTNSKK